jgi:sulfur relay (sulfurtransferase) DsrC/TusE family protein
MMLTVLLASTIQLELLCIIVCYTNIGVLSSYYHSAHKIVEVVATTVLLILHDTVYKLRLYIVHFYENFLRTTIRRTIIKSMAVDL